MGDTSQVPSLLPQGHQPQPWPQLPQTRLPQQGRYAEGSGVNPHARAGDSPQQEEPCHLVPDSEEPALVTWAWVMGAGTGLPDTGHIPP